MRAFAVLLVAACVENSAGVYAQQPAAMKVPAPEFAGIDAWLNTKPLALKDLRGKVVVVHFWAFG